MPLICGLDPGTTESALVVWDGARVRLAAQYANEDLVALLLRSDSKAAGCLLAVEQVESYGMAVGREVFETVWWAGRFVQAFESTGGRWRMVPRRAVKLHLCGSMRAKDGNIAQALLDRFGPKGTKKAPGVLYGISSHRWAALALAVTVLDTQTGAGAAKGAGADSAGCGDV